MPFSRANAEMEMNRVRAFTLIELLVVIVIIAVLMGIAFPVFSSIQNSARKTQAKNDVTQIVTAVNAFYTEYGKYPLPSTASGDGYSVGDGTTPSKAMFDALRGLDPLLNPRQVVFISPAEDASQASPKAKVGSDGQFHDPWTSPYTIRIDADYDNKVPNPYGANGGAGPDPLRQGVIAWSLGKNGALGGGAAAGPSFDSESGTANVYTSSGDVISWQ
jgi:prepilin-type N-terminal cleavage/methylation domain-containing protein